MMKNKPLLPIAILLIVGATLFANPFTQNNYVGTWNNTIVYKDNILYVLCNFGLCKLTIEGKDTFLLITLSK